jgi:hypothetical protein
LFAKDRLGIANMFQLFVARGGFIERKTLRGLISDTVIFVCTILFSLVCCRVTVWLVSSINQVLAEILAFGFTVLFSIIVSRIVAWAGIHWSRTLPYAQLGFVFGFMLIAATIAGNALLAHTVHATAGINQELSFEGKVVDASGLNIPDGTYNMEFKIYAGGTEAGGGTLDWTGDRLVSGGNGVTFNSGTFQVNLGSVNAFGGSIDWNSYPLYLSLQVGSTTSCTPAGNFTANCGGDGEMSPYILLTSTPYAMNAGELNGYTSADFGQLTASQTWTGANTIQTTSTTALQVQDGSSFNAFTVDTSNDNVGVGTAASPIAALQVERSTYTSNEVVINDGTTGTPNAYPGGYTPTLTVNDSEVSGSRPLFFGYQNGAGWDAILTSGACGAFTKMCIDLGSGTVSTAIENAGTTLQVGGGDDGSFSTVSIQPSSAISLSADTSVASGKSFTANGSASFQSNVTMAAGSSGTALSVAASTPPTANMVSITNAGQPITTDNANGLAVNYTGGSAAVEGSGMRVDYTPGGTGGGTWDGLHIVANPTGPTGGVTSYGVKVDGPTSPGSGTQEGIKVTTGFDIGLDIDSGGMQMADMSSVPSAPSANELKVYARQIAGRSMLAEQGPSGVAYALQPSLFQQNVVLVTGGANTNNGQYTTIGSNVTGSGTLTAQNGSDTEALGNSSRIATGTTAGTVAGFFTKNVYYLGSVANGADGFFYFTRVNLNGQALNNYKNGTSGSRIFMGMCGATYTSCGSSDSPTTSNAAGFQFSGARGDSDFQFLTCNASACNLIDTGVAISNSSTFDFYTYTPPQGTTVYWRIDDVTDGTAPVEGSTATDLPVGSGAMNAGLSITNLSGANRFLYFQRMYLETDR